VIRVLKRLKKQLDGEIHSSLTKKKEKMKVETITRMRMGMAQTGPICMEITTQQKL